MLREKNILYKNVDKKIVIILDAFYKIANFCIKIYKMYKNAHTHNTIYRFLYSNKNLYYKFDYVPGV